MALATSAHKFGSKLSDLQSCKTLRAHLLPKFALQARVPHTTARLSRSGGASAFYISLSNEVFWGIKSEIAKQ